MDPITTVDSVTKTNSPTFNIKDFDLDVIPDEKVLPGPDDATDTAKKPAAESAKATQEAVDKSTPEARLAEAQKKLHEQAAQIKSMQDLLPSLQAQRRTDPRQDEVLSLLIDNLKKNNRPKEPTIEDVSKKFNEIAEQDPFNAVMTVVDHVIRQRQANSTEISAEEKARIKTEVLAEVQGLRESEQIEGNLSVLANTPNLGFRENISDFGKYLKKQFGVLGNDEIVNQAIRKVCRNSEALNGQYKNFLFEKGGPDAIAKMLENQEAKIAVKLSQSQSKTGKETPPKKSNKELILEEISPGFTDFFA